MKFKNQYLYIMITCVICFLGLFCTFFIFCKPEIKLNGKDTITLNLLEKYQELGAYTTNAFEKLNYKIKIENNIDNTKIGTYQVTYSISYHGKVITKKRNINVVDTIKPMITLVEKENIYICPNQEYQELGFTATDNYDGDITNKVEITQEELSLIEFQIQYHVKDSSGNEAYAYRKYKKQDQEKPSITLKGGQTITILKGQTYQEPGYSAQDNCDGDLTSQVEIENNLNINQNGTYTITYRVKDSSGNETSIQRTVRVITTDPAKNQVYLTFDDGPSYLTSQILDILKEENVQATFFINNFNDASIVQRMVNEGHTIAIHGYTHDYQTAYRSVESYMNNITKLREKIKQYTGVDTKIIRFLGGSSNTVSKFNPGVMTKLTQKVIEEGYFYYDWNVSSGDASSTPASQSDIYYNVTNNLKYGRHNIVLMHDSSSKVNTKNALRDIITYGKTHGFTFHRITESTPMIHHNVNN